MIRWMKVLEGFTNSPIGEHGSTRLARYCNTHAKVVCNMVRGRMKHWRLCHIGLNIIKGVAAVDVWVGCNV